MQMVDKEIAKFVDSGFLRITPYNKDQVKSNSYDLRLGEDFIRYLTIDEMREKHPSWTEEELQQRAIIDPYDADSINRDTFRYNGEYYVLPPQQFVLARTIEEVELPDFLCAQLAGKSSVGRIGVTIHQTAGFVDAGFKGTLTLEIVNFNQRPVKLYAGMSIGQLVFNKTVPCCVPYNKRSGSKYVGQFNPELSMYHLNKKPYQRRADV